MNFKLHARIFQTNADRNYKTGASVPLLPVPDGMANLHMAKIDGVEFTWRETEDWIIINVITNDTNYAITKHK